MTTAPLLFPHIEPRRQAMHLFFQGYSLRAIAELLQTPEGTVSTWKKRDGWDDIKPIDRVDFALEARLCQLIAKEMKTGGDFKEIDLLGANWSVSPGSTGTATAATRPISTRRWRTATRGRRRHPSGMWWSPSSKRG